MDRDSAYPLTTSVWNYCRLNNDRKTPETDEIKEYYGMQTHAGHIHPSTTPMGVGPPYPNSAGFKPARILLLNGKYRRA